LTFLAENLTLLEMVSPAPSIRFVFLLAPALMALFAIATPGRADLAPPDYARYHGQRAYIEGLRALRSGRAQEALESARTAVQFQPEDEDAAYLLGVCLLFVERYDEAEETLQALVTANPELAEAHHDLGLVRIKLGDAAGALACFEKLAELKPDSWMGPYRAAQTAALMQEDWPTCEAQLRIALDRGFPWLASLPVDPEWAGVAEEPEFLAMLERLL